MWYATTRAVAEWTCISRLRDATRSGGLRGAGREETAWPPSAVSRMLRVRKTSGERLPMVDGLFGLDIDDEPASVLLPRMEKSCVASGD